MSACLAAASLAGADIDATPSTPERLLREAFANQYEQNSTAEIQLVTRNRYGHERRRTFLVASKIIDGRMHSIGRLTHPEHLRGMTILQIESKDRSYVSFMYLPSSQSVRRVSTAQRSDAFFGTDVSYEDLERRHARDYEVLRTRGARIDGEPTTVVSVRPRGARSYQEAHFWVANADQALLRVEFFKRDAKEPFRVITAPRTRMLHSGNHILPTWLVVENRSRGTRTEVTYNRLRVDPEIDDRVFSVSTLERRGRIPGDR